MSRPGQALVQNPVQILVTGLLTRLNDAVNSLLANTGAPEEEFTKHGAELRHVALEIDQMRDKLAEAEQQHQAKQGKTSQNSQEKQNKS